MQFRKKLLLFGLEDTLVPGRVETKFSMKPVYDILENLKSLSNEKKDFRFGVVSGLPQELALKKIQEHRLGDFFEKLSNIETRTLESKVSMIKSGVYKKDDLFTDCATYDSENRVYNLQFDLYRERYYAQKFSYTDETISIDNNAELCREYLNGMHWVINYYINGIPSWNWIYPHYYAPFICDLRNACRTFTSPVFVDSGPEEPFMQLLCILPPQSADLIPRPLNTIPTNPRFSQFYPENITVDVSGKRREWEGIVILPMVDTSVIREEYNRLKEQISDRDKRRNSLGKTIKYTYDAGVSREYRSFYGKISDCKAVLRYE